MMATFEERIDHATEKEKLLDVYRCESARQQSLRLVHDALGMLNLLRDRKEYAPRDMKGTNLPVTKACSEGRREQLKGPAIPGDHSKQNLRDTKKLYIYLF